MKLIGALFVLGAASVLNAQPPVKCEASLNGYRMHTVYITGNHFNGVAWAYKHISEATCLTPVTDEAKADAILEVISNKTPRHDDAADPLTVTCTSSLNSSSCLDSSGNELTVDCDRNGNCSSYYGPSLASAVGGALHAWVMSAWYESEVKLYTPDHKILWKSDGIKGQHWYDGWADKLREATFTTLPADCKTPAGKSTDDHFRKWVSEKCGVTFDPLVSIDIKANARLAAKNAKTEEADEMKRNAVEAAAKQQQ